MPGIGIILNPHSKSNRQNPAQMERIGFIVGDKGSCAQTKDFNDLKRVAQEFKDREIDVLGINGGDGTIHRTIMTFLKVYGDKPLPQIALLRGGTINNIAMACGIYGRSEKIISNLIYKYHNGEPFKTKTVRPMKINDQYGFIWGCGVVYRFIDKFYKLKSRSPFLAAGTLLHAIGSGLVNGRFANELFDPFGAEVEINGKKWELKNYSALYAATVPYIGLHFKTFYLTEKNPDIFHAVGFCMKPRSIVPYMPAMFFGRPSGAPTLREEGATEMTIHFSEPVPYTIDGDCYKAEESLRFSIGPALTILIP
ncbi:MAG: diacylglycerol kinase family protein [bacterium]|nr:diacylglycerol kinase family protein [bacterium]